MSLFTNAQVPKSWSTSPHKRPPRPNKWELSHGWRFLSYSNFGNPPVDLTERSREAVRLLDERGGADFEYEGEMTPDIALDAVLRERHYPFSRLTGPRQCF